MLNLPFIKSKKLLNIDRNHKTVKGQKKGFKTAVLYLAPSDFSGFNVCPQASEGCRQSCLYTAGFGTYKTVKQGRINKTRWFMQDRESFMKQLIREIANFVYHCEKTNFIPCLRLNGTSDIAWEKICCNGKTVFDYFPNLQIYDYTKVYKRALSHVFGKMPENYHLTFSLNERNLNEALEVLKLGGNVSAVFRNKLPKKYQGFEVINADENDLRFTDSDNVICGLIAKGKARTDYSGFVLDV
jgi:hypothetical protein